MLLQSLINQGNTIEEAEEIALMQMCLRASELLGTIPESVTEERRLFSLFYFACFYSYNDKHVSVRWNGSKVVDGQVRVH